MIYEYRALGNVQGPRPTGSWFDSGSGISDSQVRKQRSEAPSWLRGIKRERTELI